MSDKFVSYSNPFEAIYADKDEAFTTHIKSNLIIALTCLWRESGMTQAAFAKKLGVSQPRVSNMLNGRLDKFSIDTLLLFCRRVGLSVKTEFSPKSIDIFSLTIKGDKNGSNT